MIESPRTGSGHVHMCIDLFLRSLAKDKLSRAAAVILSGSGSDGALGVAEIKSAGGVTFAQDDASAKFNSMPRHAVATAAVDFVLTPEGIAKKLTEISQNPFIPHSGDAEDSAEQTAYDLIFKTMRSLCGVDFSCYKKNTLNRRLQRRMMLKNISTLPAYADFVEKNSSEGEALGHDLLIRVTSFFRDLPAFEALKTKVFPEFLHQRNETPIRVWVPGCSTGEEVYSIAICLIDFLATHHQKREIQVFATDVSEHALNIARLGRYVENIVSDVSPEFLLKYFTKSNDYYQINKNIREACVFAKQNITSDPPFSKIDLISCRNVLIYLEPFIQKKVMPMFHYALNPKGFLFLGTSETVGNFSDLFDMFDRNQKIYAKKNVPSRLLLDIGGRRYPTEFPTIRKPASTFEPKNEFDLQKEADKLVLSRYAPDGVVIDNNLEVLQFRGKATPFFELSPGTASLNLFKILKPGLFGGLRSAIQKAQSTRAPVENVRLRMKNAENDQDVLGDVIPIEGPGREFYLLVLLKLSVPESTNSETKVTTLPRDSKSARDSELELMHQELESTKQYLQNIIEEHEKTNEELKAANEEILSGNEELQSTNEELETAKEELQSANEELNTMNQELRTRNSDLARLTDDQENILKGIPISVVLLGRDLHIRRVNTMAEKTLRLLPTDIGRPIFDIHLGVEIPNFKAHLIEVMEKLSSFDFETEGVDGNNYSLRLRPYKTTDSRIDGVLLTAVDTTEVKKALTELSHSQEFSQGIVDTIQEGLLVLDSQLRVKAANPSFCDMFQVSAKDAEGLFVYDLGNGQWQIPQLKLLLEDILPHQSQFQGFKLEHHFSHIGKKTLILNARSLRQNPGSSKFILLAIREDISKLRKKNDVGSE